MQSRSQLYTRSQPLSRTLMTELVALVKVKKKQKSLPERKKKGISHKKALHSTKFKAKAAQNRSSTVLLNTVSVTQICQQLIARKPLPQ